MTATWTDPRDWSTGELVTSSVMNTHVRDNLDFLKTPATSGRIQIAANFTTTSTSYTDVTGITSTFTTSGGGVDVFLRITVSHSASSSTSFQLVVDGTPILLGRHNNGGTFVSVYSAFEHLAALSAGSHTIKLQCKAGGAGTVTIIGTTAATDDPLFYCVERGA